MGGFTTWRWGHGDWHDAEQGIGADGWLAFARRGSLPALDPTVRLMGPQTGGC